MKNFKNVVSKLIEKGFTISTMESCTGGGVCNERTNVPGASSVLLFSAITYSNSFKIKMGVDSEIIDKYSVYSMETAISMAKAVSSFSDSDIGVGITGKLKRGDPANDFGDDSTAYFSIYDKVNDKFYNVEIKCLYDSREDNKRLIIDKIIEKLEEIL